MVATLASPVKVQLALFDDKLCSSQASPEDSLASHISNTQQKEKTNKNRKNKKKEREKKGKAGISLKEKEREEEEKKEGKEEEKKVAFIGKPYTLPAYSSLPIFAYLSSSPELSNNPPSPSSPQAVTQKKITRETQANIQTSSRNYCVTEYLLYYFWDGIKQQNKEIFFDSLNALNQYLTEEQFNTLFQEVRWHMTLRDKRWLLHIFQGHKLSPLLLLLPCHHQQWALFNLFPSFPYPPSLTTTYPVFFLLFLYLALWENN